MILCIDAGASSSKWCAKDLGGQFTSGKVGALTGHIFDDFGFQEAQTVLNELRDQVSSSELYEEVIIGVSGLDKDSDISRTITRIIAEVFEVHISSIRLVSDMELAFESVLNSGTGILIYAGTGAIAVCVDQNRIFHRAGGWGFHNGDDGGGYFIGRGALRHVTGLWDIGLDPMEDPLASAVLMKAGAKNWSGLRSYVYGGGRSAVGELALAVREQAILGSEPSLQILREAGVELAKLGIALGNRLNLNNFVAMGGTFRLHPLILDSMAAGIDTKVNYFDVDISRQWIERHR